MTQIAVQKPRIAIKPIQRLPTTPFRCDAVSASFDNIILCLHKSWSRGAVEFSQTQPWCWNSGQRSSVFRWIRCGLWHCFFGVFAA